MKSSDLRIVVQPTHLREKSTPQAVALDSPCRSLKRRLREGSFRNVNTISSSREYIFSIVSHVHDCRYEHVESALNQYPLLVLETSNRYSDKIKNTLEDTPFDKGTW